MRRRVHGWLAALLCSVLALTLTACAPAPSDSPPLTAGVDSSLLPFYAQQPEWSGCGDDAECATVQAPMDWSDPGDGQTVSLAVTRHRHSGASGVLFMNPGGPGVAATQYVEDSSYRDYFFGDAIQRAFDIVTWDPRGVGRSSAVRCLDDEQMNHYLYDLPSHTIGSADYVTEMQDSFAAFGRACQENSGDLLAHVDTASTARDLDMLRAVLGQERANYLGFSYGTRLGATYASLFPDHVGSFVLDGAVDPSLSAEQMLIGQVNGFDGAARAYLTDCLANQGCPFTGSVDDAGAQLHDLVAGLERAPIPASDGRELGAATMLTAVSAAMYSQQTWQQLTSAIVSVRAGDPSGAFELADGYNDRDADGGFSSNSTEAFNAINCLDYPVQRDAAEHERSEQQLRTASTIFGDFYADGTTMCAGWPVDATGRPGELHADTASPIVVVGTTGDPATPYEWAQHLASMLGSARLVTNVGEGHTAYNTMANTCVRVAVEAFLVDGTAPEEGLRCE